MKRETRRAKLLDLWDDDEEVIEAIKESLPKSELDRIDDEVASNEAEAALIYVGSYEDFYRSECAGCGRTFAHSYARVTTCSNRCLRRAIEALGFTWEPKHPTERWRPKQTVHLDSPQKQKGENPKDFAKRQEGHLLHLQTKHPVPLTVPAEVVDILDREGIVPIESVPLKPSLDTRWGDS